jgi:acetolactate synthase regulatory subunit
MIKKLIEHKSFKVVIELIVLGIFAWTFTQVRDLPTTYATKAEANQVKTELKIDLDRAIDPIREQVQQIYNHLLGAK